jgi:hypothetical protein
MVDQHLQVVGGDIFQHRGTGQKSDNMVGASPRNRETERR